MEYNDYDSQVEWLYCLYKIVISTEKKLNTMAVIV